ncbi:hypothetical protein [Paenibacillus cremeus]|uniref:Uncharacterized protein n=1 Tax=Paenibacillus cremeus TaxID=2163881 RepID=A0A559KBM0_9BACL|nr:hypothetical protein [Paenibacillus cremeus]TVY09526.1 hypothetical protein FPZ49_12325 [Paenibacillus cremeus]
MFRLFTKMFKKQDTSSYDTIEVCVPRYYFKRADVFIEDIRHLKEAELPDLNKSLLIKVLLDNFLEDVRQGRDKFQYVVNLRRTYGDVYETKVTPPPQTNKPSNAGTDSFHWSLTKKGGSNPEEGQNPVLRIQVHTKVIDRVKMCFEDWRLQYHGHFEMEVDELVSLLFIHFITELRNGFVEDTQEEIIDFILEECDHYQQSNMN